MERNRSCCPQVTGRVGPFYLKSYRFMLTFSQHHIAVKLCRISNLRFYKTDIGIFQCRQASKTGICLLYIALIIQISGSKTKIIRKHLRTQIQFIFIINRIPFIINRVINLHTAQCRRLQYIIIRNKVNLVNPILLMCLCRITDMSFKWVQVLCQIYIISISYRICGIAYIILIEFIVTIPE